MNTAVSSHRPHTEDGEYRTNQIRAFESWKHAFNKIVYLGDPEPELKSNRTHFVPVEGWPKIKDLVRYAANDDAAYVTILNADILVNHRIHTVLQSLKSRQALAAVSRRFTFDPAAQSLEKAKLEDFGLDVFIATPQVWRMVLNEVPECFRLGHYLWDTWMVGFFNEHLKSKVVDFTNFKCVFHPRHEGRKAPHSDEIQVKPRYLHRAAIPGRKL